ncbi:MAG: GNAT family N-acetyltransferase [Solirubrobacteraceae bacterium]|nr:GNAT family N-acetyltransferase [Solirubrobacteraceae bacterium]
MSALFPPTEPLTDGVVTLRLWTEADAPARSRAFHGDAELVRWTDLPYDYDAGEALADIRRGHELLDVGERLSFAVLDARSAVIGGIDLMLTAYDRAELGYAITASARRQGNATRALRLLSDWSLSHLGVHRLELPVPLGNVASAGVARGAGYEPEGQLRSFLALRDGGPRYDVTMFSRVRAVGAER